MFFDESVQIAFLDGVWIVLSDDGMAQNAEVCAARLALIFS
jgi:hypothetical protein